MVEELPRGGFLEVSRGEHEDSSRSPHLTRVVYIEVQSTPGLRTNQPLQGSMIPKASSGHVV